jgi:hypothetical protein
MESSCARKDARVEAGVRPSCCVSGLMSGGDIQGRGGCAKRFGMVGMGRPVRLALARE